MAEDDKKSLLSLTSSASSPLTAVRVAAHEIISALFRFEVEAVAAGVIDATTMLNKPACVSVNHGGKSTRYFHGIVSEFGLIEQSGAVDKLYRMVLVPQLVHASINSDCRMFFNKTAEDIVKTVFQDAGVTKVAFRLYSQPAVRKATAQFNETSLHFATRLMEEEGWYYFFEHDENGHTLVVTNDNNGFQTIAGASLRFGPGTTAEMVTEYREPELFAPGKITEAGEQVYVVREITHRIEDVSERAGTLDGTHYSNSFTCFPNSVPWRQPMTTARPRMEGLHTAKVLAPSGEEIHTDEQGRIKIRFRWDWREDATADNSEWVRVVQPWTGNQWGAQFIPRIDTEVAVAFMDADPDRPIVVGGLYNGDDKPIFPVAEKTKLGFRTRSVLKGGTDDFNELSFDDKKGSERLFLHAQKDMKTEVENDQTLTVGHDQTMTIDNDRSLTINKGNETITLKQGNQTTELQMGNQSTELKLGNISVKCDLGSITMEAMQSITLKVGMSSVKIDQMGVTVNGMMIKIDGQVMTDVHGLMTTVKGDAMLTLGGGILMIG